MISYNWLRHIFKGNSQKVHFGSAYAGDMLQLIMDDDRSKFHRTIEGLIKTLLAEDLIKAPDPKMSQKRKNSNDSTKAVAQKIRKK